MISQSCEIDHSQCHCCGGRHTVSQICQARSPDKNLGATDPRAPVSRERWTCYGCHIIYPMFRENEMAVNDDVRGHPRRRL